MEFANQVGDNIKRPGLLDLPGMPEKFGRCHPAELQGFLLKRRTDLQRAVDETTLAKTA